MTTLTVASSLADALSILRTPGMRPIAGGVGVMLARALGSPWSGTWVGIGALPELRVRRHDDDGWLRIGSAVTLEAIGSAHAVPAVPPLLAAADRSAANPGVRAMATIGGNVVGTGAGSDLVAALIALGAQVDLVGAEHSRTVPLADLWPDPGGHPAEVRAAALEPGELVRAIRLPPAPSPGWGWQRLTVQGRMGGSVASVAVTIARTGEARVVLTAAGSRPLRLRAAEAPLGMARRHGHDAEAVLRAVRDGATADVSSTPLLDDVIASAAYRRQVTPVLVERAARAALARDADDR